MHTAISALRGAAKENRMEGFDEDARECLRASDLLQSLASPPETVEELRDRVELLAPNGNGEVRADVHNPFHVDLGPFVMGAIDASPKHIRAAWFAIVGMTLEVER